jgi:Ca2+-binding EF-hand superfamily protein
MQVENNLKSLFFIYATLNILSVEEKSVYLREFYNLDKNKDGKIDFDELVEGMQNTFEVDLETAVERVKKIF